MVRVIEIERGPFYCTKCGADVDAKFIYSYKATGRLINKNEEGVRTAIRQGQLEYRYELKRGRLRRVCDYFQIWKFISLHLPTPEELRTGDWNTTKEAMKKILAFRERNADRLRASQARKKMLKEAEKAVNEEGGANG